MKLRSKSISFASPQRSITAYEYCQYTKPSGLDMMRVRFLELKDDIYDHFCLSFSSDNGQTWPETKPEPLSQKTPRGMLRRFHTPGFVDPVSGRLLEFILEGVFPHDSPLDGMKAYYLTYRVSEDGGRTAIVEERVVQRGHTPEHPCAHVWVGRNALMTGAPGSVLRSRRGHLIVATQLCPVGPDGEYYNPGGGYTWTEVLILFGCWQADGPIEWDCGPRVAIEPSRSTRGVIEPTLAQMPDGRILMVMRGSNGGSQDPDYQIPGYKWYSVSADEGFTWTDPQPWRYSDGSTLYSPSSISQLVPHSSGKYYWFGNVCSENPRGNLPRYPLVAAEVDPRGLVLVRDSLFVVDDRQPEDPPALYLSNFYVYEDRATGELVLHMTRMFQESDGTPGGDAYVYRIEP